jgi:UDP-N-acetylmuramoylalanine--D-glutamate ligase
MKEIPYYKDKQVLVLGMAKSGYSAAKLLVHLGARVVVNDRADLEGDPRARELAALGVKVVGGGHPSDLVTEETDVMIKNPGIPYTNPLVEKAERLGIPVITEVELAAQVSEAPFVGITGSNGKTTTTALIGEMLKGGPARPIVAGNIGTALSEVAQSVTAEDVIVAELSSFQLLGTRTFRPRTAVFLNLFEAHLDYHGSMEAYAQAKAMITKNQTPADVLVYNADDPLVKKWTADTRAQKVPFSLKEQVDGAYLSDGVLYFKGEAIIRRDRLGMPNVDHNVANALAAVAVAKVHGVATDFIRRVLEDFKGMKHRLQYVTTINGRAFYNDSKATNVLATSKALNAFHQPIILLAGGLDRGNDFDGLIPGLSRVKAVIAFGQTKEKIAGTAEKAGVKRVRLVDNMAEAVTAAYGLSEPGDVILLSPACASWDQYRSYEERGDMFIKSVHTLK